MKSEDSKEIQQCIGLHRYQQHQHQQRRQRGLIHFRPIQSADRVAIEKLHHLWFPVQYTPDFFDMLCNTQTTSDGCVPSDHDGGCNEACVDVDQQRRSWQRQRQQPEMNSFYTCVACFRELNDDEFEKYQLLMQRKGRYSNNEDNIGGHLEGWVNGDEDYDDYLLWESEEKSSLPTKSNNNDNGCYDRMGCINMGTLRGGYRHQRGAATQITASISFSNNSDDDDDEDDNVIENGKSSSSFHRRTERERMKRFYSNGCRFDVCDDHDNDHTINIDDRYKISLQKNGTSHTTTRKQHELQPLPPCYNDKGEHIIGCIIGSFLPSSLTTTRKQSRSSSSNASSSSLNIELNKHKQQHEESPSRDETASLLIPNPSIHRTMFYIMTLGTCREFRRCGLGSKLVTRVIDMIQSQRPLGQQRHVRDFSGRANGEGDKEVGCCGALYLHVITYNEGAIKLYEKLGFMRVKKIEGKCKRKRYIVMGLLSYLFAPPPIAHRLLHHQLCQLCLLPLCTILSR